MKCLLGFLMGFVMVERIETANATDCDLCSEYEWWMLELDFVEDVAEGDWDLEAEEEIWTGELVSLSAEGELWISEHSNSYEDAIVISIEKVP
jgi:hypothetical protein